MSATFAAAIKASELGAKVTIINDGLSIGGTCVNVGCVPSKTLIRAAEVHHRALRHHFKGITSDSRVTDFKALIQQKRELVEELRQAKYLDVVADLPDFQLIEGRAQSTESDTVAVNGPKIKADRILIATGVTSHIPPVAGLEESGYLTNVSAFELTGLPKIHDCIRSTLHCVGMRPDVCALGNKGYDIATILPDFTDRSRRFNQ